MQDLRMHMKNKWIEIVFVSFSAYGIQQFHLSRRGEQRHLCVLIKLTEPPRWSLPLVIACHLYQSSYPLLPSLPDCWYLLY